MVDIHYYFLFLFFCCTSLAKGLLVIFGVSADSGSLSISLLGQVFFRFDTHTLYVCVCACVCVCARARARVCVCVCM